jgi:type IV pilus assembly protein PilA
MNSARFPHIHRAFTLIEVMVVVVIIGLLAAISALAIYKYRSKVMHTIVLNDARQIASAANQYFIQESTANVAISIDSIGNIQGPLSAWVKNVDKNLTISSPLLQDGTLEIRHPLVRGGISGQGQFGDAIILNLNGGSN